MQTNGINSVESFDDLSKVSDEKLLKLRDVSREYLQETFADYQDARNRVIAIEMQLQTRGITKPKE